MTERNESLGLDKKVNEVALNRAIGAVISGALGFIQGVYYGAMLGDDAYRHPIMATLPGFTAFIPGIVYGKSKPLDILTNVASSEACYYAGVIASESFR